MDTCRSQARSFSSSLFYSLSSHRFSDDCPFICSKSKFPILLFLQFHFFSFSIVFIPLSFLSIHPPLAPLPRLLLFLALCLNHHSLLNGTNFVQNPVFFLLFLFVFFSLLFHFHSILFLKPAHAPLTFKKKQTYKKQEL